MKVTSPRATAELPILDLPSGALGSDGPSLTAFARLDGRVVVVMELGEYRQLLSDALSSLRKPGGCEKTERRADQRGHSTIDRDPEVAAFLRARFPRRETIARLHAACIEQFGAERAPSSGRIQTFRGRWRR